MKYYKLLLFFLLFLIISCDVSTISDKKLNNISNIEAKIYIQDGVENNSLEELKIYISDGKKQIINEKIQITVNETPLKLRVKKDLYYTKKSHYSFKKFPRSDSYYFKITLPDSTVYPLAFIKPKTIQDSLRFNVEKSISIDTNLTINWNNINTPAELTIWKGVQNTVTKERSGGQFSETTIKENINSKTGKYLLPKSYFKDSIYIAKYLKIKINHREYGLTNPKLLPSSEIFYNFEIEKKVAIYED